jgi:hypothetical protein
MSGSGRTNTAPLPLFAGAGFDEVQHLADQSGITVIQ